MSSPVPPPHGPTASGRPSPAGAAAGRAQRSGVPFPLAPGGAQAHAYAVSAIPASPPADVLDEVAAASAVHARLRAQDRELHFGRDAQNGCLTIEVRDGAGNVLRTLSPAQALEVAAGKPLE